MKSFLLKDKILQRKKKYKKQKKKYEMPCNEIIC